MKDASVGTNAVAEVQVSTASSYELVIGATVVLCVHHSDTIANIAGFPPKFPLQLRTPGRRKWTCTRLQLKVRLTSARFHLGCNRG